MTAGRELDALVHERIFGLVVKCRDYLAGPREVRDGTLSNFCLNCGDPHGYHDCWPAYSTQIGAAWQVVEKLRSTEAYPGSVFDFEIEQKDRVEQGLWLASSFVYNWPEKQGQIYATADTAPLAICLIALKAFGANP